MEIHARAPAKVNLHLEILGRRGDGYHDVLSLFQMVSLYDELVFRPLKSSRAVELSGSFDCEPRQNLIVKAVQVFRRASGREDGVHIEVDKRIPAGAGLGGGSSDAAATLLALDRLWDAGMGRQRLMALATELGSDVSFFLSDPAGAAALVQGRGEMVRPLDGRTDFHLLLASPGFAVATGEAYGWLDSWRRRFSRAETGAGAASAADLERMYLQEPVARWRLANSFEEVVEERYPEIGEIRREMLEAGARQARLSGSGSAVFGLFSTRSAAEEAARGPSLRNCLSWVVAPLAKAPELGLN